MLSRRRWQSIDRKLPLLASGLVLVTVVVLGWTAYVLFERVLLDRAGHRLLTSSQIVTEMFGLPQRRRDSTALAAERTLVAFLHRRASRREALDALTALRNPRDTTTFHTALIDLGGNVLVDSHRTHVGEPRWASEHIASGNGLTGTSVRVGPVEDLGGVPVMSYAYALFDPARADSTPIGYVGESRVIASGRTAKLIRQMIGSGVTMEIGQPDTGAWTDLERVLPPPPRAALADRIVDVDGSIAASSTIPGSAWIIWVAQQKHDILAPTRTLLWTMLPLGLAIAVAGAALMWRIARRIASPIVQLTAAVERVAPESGLMPTTDELPLPNQDEVSRLRVAFERMAARIADREALELQLRHAQ
ncbi:MAG TPA: HAMP domain-containing protein, partial [Gemmatimonadaceae bacterium]|nr:HAMP domain-containing protein [Gemmatimonadaceae bacterium]